MAMITLGIDLETYSSVDLKESGVYAYTASSDFEILLFAYSFNDSPVKVVDLKCGEEVPEDVMEALTNPLVIKTAYNANFERTCITRHFNLAMNPDQWRCTAVYAANLGLPPKLGQVAEVLGFPEDKRKMGIGYSLIRYFCIPCKPTKTNGERTRNLPEHDPEKWNLFKQYCGQDVVTEQAIRAKLIKFPIPAEEQQLWSLDQKINDRGIRIDSVLAENAIKCDKQYADKLMTEAIKLTGLTSQPARFLATIQVGITFAGFLGSAFAADNFSGRLARWLIKLGVGIPEQT
jgi:DNA polymerase